MKSVFSFQFSVFSKKRGTRSVSSGRHGVTIMEVLFSILVTTVGLLGAIALFPVASGQARKGLLLESIAVGGRTAVHTFDARGMRRPDMWLEWRQDFATPQFSAASITNGKAFCIDARLLAAASLIGTIDFQVRSGAQTFPYQEPFTDANNNNQYDSGESYVDSRIVASNGNFYSNGSHDPPLNTGVTPNRATPMMRRITLRSANSATAGPMGLVQSNSLFFIDDDMAINRDETDRSRPASQLFDYLPTATTATPSRRQTEGRLSWMATVVPKIDDYSSELTDEFVLSIVLFNDRPADLSLDALHERVVHAQLQGDGSSGGEVLLHWNCSTDNLFNQEVAAKVLKLRAGNWIMLMGARTSNFIGRFQWYRVTEADHDVFYNSTPGAAFDNEPGYQIYATLMGQDWNTALINTQNNSAYAGGIAGTCQATLMDGVIGVHEKTIRLEYGSAF